MQFSRKAPAFLQKSNIRLAILGLLILKCIQQLCSLSTMAASSNYTGCNEQFLQPNCRLHTQRCSRFPFSSSWVGCHNSEGLRLSEGADDLSLCLRASFNTKNGKYESFHNSNVEDKILIEIFEIIDFQYNL